MGDRFTPGEHQCAETPCFDCGRGLDPVDFVIVRQLRRLRREVAALTALVQQIAGDAPPRPAVGIRTTLKGEHIMDLTLDVDVTGETVTAVFVDDKGDTGATPPAGPDGTPATIGFTSSDDTVVTVDTAGNLSFLRAGTATLTATAVDSTGTPIAGFPTGSVNLTLTPGVAAGLQVSVQGAPPVPAP